MLEKKLNDHTSTITKLTNDLLKKFKKISSQGLTKDLIGQYIIFDDAKYFLMIDHKST